ncbi:DCC1-like thiol-disulfide oxidoreductase family protein [Prochlorococcus marinus]|uniref:DCC1-like thiol-disulfide oxidoreductase family protein n=1 Tax=Prochlorococcus marinus TaxID=1219 RepID=UPI0022B4AE9B|nr:DCC1-like thiol-disulfide oxidoreductase family protein [Prochlorococcus marinus]
MSDKSLFIYDGECPFCNHFAQLLELKSSLTELEILDGRKNLALLSQLYNQGYDLNKGAILIKDEKIMHGADAINWICSEIKEPSDSLLEVLRIIFTSNKRTNFLFPFLLWGRRLSLTLKGKVWQPVSENSQYY